MLGYKFKKGDRVKVIPTTESYYTPVGATGTFEFYDTKHAWFVIDEEYEVEGITNVCIKESDLELIEPNKTTEANAIPLKRNADWYLSLNLDGAINPVQAGVAIPVVTGETACWRLGAPTLDDRDGEDVGAAATSKPIKSDGGSSDYYKISIKLPQELYDASGNLVTEVTFETQDLLYAMFYGEWSCCNVGKAARRIAEALQGRGKEGTPIAYDAKKIAWFGEDILKRFGKES